MTIYVPMGALYSLAVLAALSLLIGIGFPLLCVTMQVLSGCQWWRKLQGGQWRYLGAFEDQWTPIPDWCSLGITEDWPGGVHGAWRILRKLKISKPCA